MKKQPSRQRNKLIPVPILPAEKIQIKANAAQCGLPVAAYLRSLGLHHEPRSVLDANAVLELARINGDLGRLGGLLKMWLTNDNRLELVGKENIVPAINHLLNEIAATQSLLFEAAKKI
jgi:hypothetical protein